MRLLRTFTCLLALGALAACATAPVAEHRSQAEPGVELAAYRSFAWRAALGEGAGDEPMRMLDVRLRDAIRAEFLARGYVEDEAAPQMFVTYETAITDKLRSSPVRIGIGMGSFGGNVGGSVNMGTPSVQSYQEGELVVHVVDAASNREVWYGTVSGRVDRSKLDADTVARAVAIALQDFPARAAPGP